MPNSKASHPVLWKGALAGLAAGLTASAAMSAFQAAASALSTSDQEGEPATQKAADRVAQATIGQPVSESRKGVAGETVHYALGGALGLAYGAAAEVAPAVTAGGGMAFGVFTAAALDEGAAPAAGLGDPPWRTPVSTHVYTLASHLIFGVTAGLTRRLVRRALG